MNAILSTTQQTRTNGRLLEFPTSNVFYESHLWMNNRFDKTLPALTKKIAHISEFLEKGDIWIGHLNHGRV